MAEASTAKQGARVYRGMTAEDRHEDRRRRLIDTAIEVFGSEGYAGSTIEQLCARAGVTARHFYDHFAGREELLRAVYDQVIAEHMEHTLGALRAPTDSAEANVRAGLAAAIGAWVSDERKFRIAEIEVVGVSEAMEQRRLEVLEGYARLIAANAEALMERGLIPRRDPDLTATALLGATNHLLVDWLHRPRRPSIELVIDELTRIYVCALDA